MRRAVRMADPNHAGDYPCPRCGQPTSGSYIESGLLYVQKPRAFCYDCQEYLRKLREQVEYEASFDYPREDKE